MKNPSAVKFRSMQWLLIALALLDGSRSDRFGLVSAAVVSSTAAAGIRSSGASQPVTFGYTLHTSPDSLPAQVKGVEKFVRTSLRKLVGNSTNVGKATNVTSSYDSTSQETCDNPNNASLPDKWRCYDVNMTFTLPLGDAMDALVVQQASLGLVQSILQQYNAQNFDEAFVEYREPKFVDSMLRVYAVGLTRSVMNTAQQELFLQVFHQGFDSMLASPASQVPMNVFEAKVLYQIPPLAVPSADGSSTGASFRTRLDPNSTSIGSSTSDGSSGDAPLTSNVAVHMTVRATCAGPNCHDDALARALWDKVGQHADAWAAGIHQQAEKSSNSALRNYFDPLITIVLESPTSLIGSLIGSTDPNSSSGAHDVYHPTSEVDHDNYGVPTWLWIVLGVDIGILLVALLVAYCRVAKRRKEFAGDDPRRRKDRDAAAAARPSTTPSWSRPHQDDPIPEQYPEYKEPYPNMAGLKEAAGSSHHSDEFHDEGSDRVFDDGIRVREAQEDSAQMGDLDDEDGSERIFDDGIRVLEAHVEQDDEGAGTGGPQIPPLPQEAPPPPPPPPAPSVSPPEERPYDDGIRLSVEDSGLTSRVHDDGIHISNSIHDID